MRIAEAQLVKAVDELQREGQLVGTELAAAFAKFLRRKRLSRRVGKIGRALDTYAEQSSGVLSVTATSARALSVSERQRVEEAAAQLLGQPEHGVAIEFREETDLIGGLRLETTNTRLDGTVARALKELRKSL